MDYRCQVGKPMTTCLEWPDWRPEEGYGRFFTPGDTLPLQSVFRPEECLSVSHEQSYLLPMFLASEKKNATPILITVPRAILTVNGGNFHAPFKHCSGPVSHTTLLYRAQSKKQRSNPGDKSIHTRAQRHTEILLTLRTHTHTHTHTHTQILSAIFF